MNETALLFIQKAIEKTKNHSLKWYSLHKGKNSPTILHKPTEDTVSYTTKPAELLSFYSKYNNGYIFLLCYENFLSNEYSLEIQTESSPFAKQLASSTDTLEISTQLKRLYNIVEDYSSDITIFIDDFLNS